MLLAKLDVAGFGFEDAGQFLSDTWMLIDESNTPISMFLGDIRISHSVKIQDFLRLKPNVQRDMDPVMLDILENGCPQSSTNDTSASPVRAHLYLWLWSWPLPPQVSPSTSRVAAR